MINAIVATHSGLYETTLSEKGELVHCERVAQGYHYGVWVENENRFWVYRGGENVHEQTERELRLYERPTSRPWAEGRAIPLPDSIDAVHQIVLISAGQFVVTNTLYNEIVTVDPEGGEVLKRLRFDETNSDRNHVNSFVEVDGGFGLAMLHNLRRQESELALIDLTDLSEVARTSLPDIQCHNIGLVDGKLVYNGSGRRNLTGINLETGRRVSTQRFEEHPKGLACDAKTLLVGSSNYASRAERGRSYGWISAVDPASFEIAWTTQLRTEVEGPSVGNVNEIRLLAPHDTVARSKYSIEDLTPLFEQGMSAAEVQARRAGIALEDRLKRTIRRVRNA